MGGCAHSLMVWRFSHAKGPARASFMDAWAYLCSDSFLTRRADSASSLSFTMTVTSGSMLGASSPVSSALSPALSTTPAPVLSPLVESAVTRMNAAAVTGVSAATSIVIASVGIAGIAVVGSAVAASVTGAGASAAISGGGGGGGMASLLGQAQFISVAGRVGGKGTQTPATQTLSDGLAWTNGHIVRFNMTDVCPAMEGVSQELVGTVRWLVFASHHEKQCLL